MKEKMSRTKAFKIKQNIFFGLIFVSIVGGIVLYKFTLKPQITYTVVNGYVEKVDDTTAALIKQESVLELRKDSSAIPVVEQGKRAAKDEVLAVYKSEDYDEYLSKINDMDESIASLVKDLPTTYSLDITNIQNEISSVTKNAYGENSYLKMQEYKSMLDELSYRKVNTLSELSPAGSKIRELIEERKALENQNKMSGDNIKASVSGVVTYKIDGLENIVDFSKVEKLSSDKIDEIFGEYKENNINNFGIKIINNYSAYLITKVPRGENDKYIKEGSVYKLKLNGNNNNNTLEGTLIKNIQTDQFNYSIFHISNGIEDLIDNRLLDVEIIWNREEGMAVLKNAIKRNTEDTYYYVTLVNGGQYMDIPIKIVSSSDTVCIVENFSKEERESLNITTTSTLQMYDVLVVQE